MPEKVTFNVYAITTSQSLLSRPPSGGSQLCQLYISTLRRDSALVHTRTKRVMLYIIDSLYFLPEIKKLLMLKQGEESAG